MHQNCLLETWRHCGKLPTVIVSNMWHPCLDKFASQHGPYVQIQTEPALVPGDIYTMSADCNSKLFKRFDTDYLLIVQRDGFPLRNGLEEFLKLGFDFYGAPLIRDTRLNRLICGFLGCWVSNGGFSLRSHNICELAAGFWNKYKSLGNVRTLSEDIYYTEFLPFRERSYRKNVRIADCRNAIRFSFDDSIPVLPHELPFGFHGASTPQTLKRLGLLN